MALPASPPVTGSSGPFPNQLDQLVDRAIRDAVDRFRGNVLAELHAGVVAAAIAAVAAHIRDATNHPDQLDPRLDSAIDDFFSGPTVPSILVHRIDGDADHMIRGPSRRVPIDRDETTRGGL